jgi:hypothetical protein
MMRKSQYAIQAICQQRRLTGLSSITVKNTHLFSNSSDHQQQRQFALSLRRARKYEGHFKASGKIQNFGKLQEPFQPEEKSLEHYLEKTSLSPWTPIPDAVARKMLDLESQLAGRRCKILTCGYEMPGWQSRLDEVVLGTQIHLYEWGTECEDDAALELFMGEDILQQKPEELLQRQIEGSQFAGSTVIDRCNKVPIQGYNPNLKFEEEDDDEDWDAVSSDDEEQTITLKESVTKKTKSSTPCSKH